MKKSPVAVFDSGMGGLTVLHEIRQALPHADLIFYGDSAHNPYGTKSAQEITARSIAICDRFMEEGAQAIVVACNTATSAAIQTLRSRYPIPVIGMEPALKPACEMGNRRIAVWATAFTLKEKKFAELMERYGKDHEIVKVACPRLVRLVEEDRLADAQLVEDVLKDYIRQSGPVDAIVLGCTHFPFFKKQLEALVPGVSLIDGNQGTARHLAKVLNGKADEGYGTMEWQNSDENRIGLERRLYTRLEEQDGKRMAGL